MICKYCEKPVTDSPISHNGQSAHIGCFVSNSVLFKAQEAAKQALQGQMAGLRAEKSTLTSQAMKAELGVLMVVEREEKLKIEVAKLKEEVAKLKAELAQHTGPGSFQATRIQPAPARYGGATQPGGAVPPIAELQRQAAERTNTPPKPAPVESPKKDRMELIELE